MREKEYGRLHLRRPQAKNKGIYHPFSYSFACPQQGIKNATGLCYPWRCPGRWPVCIQLYGHGAEAPIDGCCTHISAFRGLSACQGSLNSSKIVVNKVVLTCLKCPWIQCFQGIIRFRLDFLFKSVDLLRQMPLSSQNFGHILTDLVDAVLVGDALALDVLTLQRAAQQGLSGR